MLRAIWRTAKRVPGVEKAYLKFRYRQYLESLRSKSAVGNGPNILIINHHFDQDIEALVQGCSEKCRFFVVDCMPFFNQAFLFFRTDAERDGIIPYPLLPPSVVRRYRNVARGLFEDLYAIFPFDAVVAPSDSFWWLREFFEVVKENGRARIVLDKEGTISPYSYEIHSKQIREKFPFMSDYLLVWSKRQREFWIKSGVPPECIRVLGQPRSDFFFESKRWRSRKELGLRDDRKVILFFTFDLDAYINLFPVEQVRHDSLSWLPLRNDINEVLIEYAKTHKTVDIVIKTHPQQSDINEIREIFRNAGLENILLMEGAYVSNHLIVNADLIVGFQTTALTEAMLTNKPVIYTGWSTTEKKVREHLIPFQICKGLQIAESKKHFAEILHSWTSGAGVGGDVASRKEFTDHWLNADGEVCDRVAEALIDIVNRTKVQSLV